MLFMESLEDNEAVVFRGYEQFSEYAGYANKLQFAGDFRDNCKVIIMFAKLKCDLYQNREQVARQKCLILPVQIESI